MNAIPEWLQVLVWALSAIIIILTIYKIFKKNFKGWFKPNNSWVETNKTKYDFFISTPMSSFKSDNEYQEHRKIIIELINYLKSNTKYNCIYFSGETLSNQDEFLPPDQAVRRDFGALEASRIFVLIFPGQLNSSVIVEAGYALALGKPSIYFIKDRHDLPFMLREVTQIEQAKVKLYEANDIKKVKQIMTNNMFLNLIKLFY